MTVDAALYDAALADILAQKLDWAKDEIRVALLERGYEFSPTHTCFSDVAAFVNGASASIPGRKAEGRHAMAGECYLLAARQAYSDQLVVYRHAEKAADMRLICWSCTPAVLPVAGQRIDVPWPEGLVFVL